MRFAVVACPGCRRVQVAELRFQTSRCRGCTQTLELHKLKAFHRTDEEAEARAAHTRISAQLEGMPIEDYARLLEHLEKQVRGTADQVLESLATRGDFDEDAFANEARRLRVPGNPENLLAALVASNRLYEPRPGLYRVV